MATRFYPQPITQPTVTPSVSSGWNKTSGFGRRKLLTTKVDANSAGPNLAANGVANTNTLQWQLISEPLNSQVFGGTLKGQLRVLETNATDDYYPQLRAFIVAPDGTVRGVLVELHTNGISSEFATSLTNRSYPLAALNPVTVSSVVAAKGDRIVIEIGIRQAGTSTANFQTQLRDSSATDLAEDEVTTTANNSWFEFSQNIVFQGGGSGGPGALSIGIGMGI